MIFWIGPILLVAYCLGQELHDILMAHKHIHKRSKHMAKEDVVMSIVADMETAEHQAKIDGVGKGYDFGFVDGGNGIPSGPTGPTEEQIQARIDQAVQMQKDLDATALSDLSASDKQAFDDAKALADSAFATLQAEKDALALKEGTESLTIQNLSSAYAALQQVVAVLGTLQPQPAPEPTPAPDVQV